VLFFYIQTNGELLSVYFNLLVIVGCEAFFNAVRIAVRVAGPAIPSTVKPFLD
jgi:hypothetical protein